MIDPTAVSLPPFRIGRHLVSAILGFGVALGLIITLRNVLVGNPPPGTMAVADPPLVVKDIQPLVSRFGLPEPASMLGLHAQSRLLSSDGVRAALDEARRHSEPVRGSLVKLLLVRWAENEPAAAMNWVMENERGPQLESLYDEVGLTWAARDAPAFAKWYCEFYQKEEMTPLMFFLTSSLEWMARSDPILVAKTLAHPALKGTGLGNTYWRQLLPHISDVSHAQQLALQATEHLEISGGKGWDFLAQAAAIRWNQADHEACEAWLRTVPETAQTAIREALKNFEDGPQHQQSGASSNAEVSVTAPDPPFLRNDPTVAPAPERSRDACTAWSGWWRDDPASAETFLNNATWPEELKFRARAKAYASGK